MGLFDKFKKNKNESEMLIDNSFKIKETEFGVGDVLFVLKDNLINLEITADENVFNELIESDDSEWGWALYAPKIYFHDVPCKNGVMVVDNDFVEKYEIGLYMMEHNDFFGTVKVMDEGIYIQGKVDMMGEQLPVFISISKESL